MEFLANTQTGCCDATQGYQLCGCADGVAIIQLVVVGLSGAKTVWLNTETGETTEVKPAGFVTGNCADAVPKDNLRFSSAAPTATTPFATPLDGFTTIVTDDGTEAGEVLEYWRFDQATSTWTKIPTAKDILWTDVTTDPAATGNPVGPRFEINADGVKFFIDSEGRAEKLATDPEVEMEPTVPTPAATGNTTSLNRFVKDDSGNTYFIDSNGDAVLLERQDTGECKGMHQERDVQLSAGAPLTLTHNMALDDPRALGYSVIGVDGATVGDWPTGVRFINHTANTVDIVADTGSGVVDVVLSNVECLAWIKKGAAPTMAAAPALSYATPKTITRNVAISPIRPSVTLNGCTGAKNFTVAPALPAGLSINSTTGIISGTPTTAAAAADFVVTATQGTCTASATINLTVQAGVTAPSGMSFVPGSRSFPVGSTITTFGPVLNNDGGAPVTFSISPALPAGLTFNTLTGAISGTPTAASAAATYTMTATNSAGSTNATFTLDVYAGLTNWTEVTALSGTQALGQGVNATVTPTMTRATIAPVTGYSGATNTDPNVALSAPLKNVRISMSWFGTSDSAQILINGAVVNLTAADLTNFSGYSAVEIVSGVTLRKPTASASFAATIVTLNVPGGINSVKVNVTGSLKVKIEVK